LEAKVKHSNNNKKIQDPHHQEKASSAQVILNKDSAD
jgi:hypothetical protein